MRKHAQAHAEDTTWHCPCGEVNTHNFDLTTKPVCAACEHEWSWVVIFSSLRSAKMAAELKPNAEQ